MRETRPCRKCKAKIEFINGPSGKVIPAQKVTLVYRRADDNTLVRVVLPPGEYYISHFQTCPAAETFTRKRD